MGFASPGMTRSCLALTADVWRNRVIPGLAANSADPTDYVIASMMAVRERESIFVPGSSRQTQKAVATFEPIQKPQRERKINIHGRRLAAMAVGVVGRRPGAAGRRRRAKARTSTTMSGDVAAQHEFWLFPACIFSGVFEKYRNAAWLRVPSRKTCEGGETPRFEPFALSA
jgi:hypothetical protein